MQVIAAVLVLTLGIVAFFLYHLRSRNLELALPSTKAKTLAVLPFQVTGSKNAEDEYLGPGIADSLNMRLSKIKEFAVRPTSSVLRFNKPNQNVLDAGRKLAVEEVIEGRIERANNRVQITAHLRRVSDGTLLWADTFDEQFTSLFNVDENISRRVARALKLNLTSEEEQQLASNNTDNPEAFHTYLRGRYAWNKRTIDEIRKAIKFLKQAIELDTAYAAAYAGLADCYLLLGD